MTFATSVTRRPENGLVGSTDAVAVNSVGVLPATAPGPSASGADLEVAAAGAATTLQTNRLASSNVRTPSEGVSGGTSLPGGRHRLALLIHP